MSKCEAIFTSYLCEKDYFYFTPDEFENDEEKVTKFIKKKMKAMNAGDIIAFDEVKISSINNLVKKSANLNHFDTAMLLSNIAERRNADIDTDVTLSPINAYNLRCDFLIIKCVNKGNYDFIAVETNGPQHYIDTPEKLTKQLAKDAVKEYSCELMGVRFEEIMCSSGYIDKSFANSFFERI